MESYLYNERKAINVLSELLSKIYLKQYVKFYTIIEFVKRMIEESFTICIKYKNSFYLFAKFNEILIKNGENRLKDEYKKNIKIIQMILKNYVND